ncbi:MAG: amidohydrolase, partial [Alphaproteobacteria bacterium]|nr:amidohydrolase [Alphaproteobacteria bacterium]
MMTASNIRSLRAKSRSARAAFAALALLSTPALAQSLAITGATLAIGDSSEPIRNGTVLISAGKVTAAGAG